MTEQPTNNQTKNLFKALSLAQAELEHAKKDSLNPHYKSKYADLASCLDAIKGPFAKHGLAITQLVMHQDDKPYLKTILAHESGEYIETTTLIMLTKNDIQGLGSGITYTRRYALQAIAGLGADDDDGNAAAQPAHPQFVKLQPGNTNTNEHYNGSPQHKIEVARVVKELGLTQWFEAHKEHFVNWITDKKPTLANLKEEIKNFYTTHNKEQTEELMRKIKERN